MVRKAHKKSIIVGIDEVGRGPLAGPVTVVACAVHGSSSALKGIRDSKKCSPKKREEWFHILRAQNNIYFAITSVSPKHIDQRGMSWALKFAVAQCIKKIETKLGATVLNIKLDGGLYAPKEYKKQKTMIRGDERVPQIAAASIFAKVARDRLMVRLAKQYPNYELERHKGYGTEIHRKAIKKFGLSDIHRATFCTKII